MEPKLYYTVVASYEDCDPFLDSEHSQESNEAEEWERFLNSGFTFEPPARPGYYFVRWRPNRLSQEVRTGLFEARAARNNKSRCVWEETNLRNREVERSGEPIPLMPE